MRYINLKKQAEKLGCTVFENTPLFSYTSFKIGGPADLLLKVPNESALKGIVCEIKKENIPFFVLGNGSNLLVSDNGYRGVVILLDEEFKKVTVENENTLICGAGTMLATACAVAKRNSLTGFEFGWGIPGTIGGAIYMNAGAYGGEIKDIFISSKHIDENGKIHEFSKDDLNFAYRVSTYKHQKNLIILSAKFNLKKGKKEEIASKMKELITRRKLKQPLELPSAGSVFKRPPGYFAGTLIQESGLKRKTIGGAQISEKHAGFIVNIGGATCQNVLDLIHYVQKTIFEKIGVKMESEINTLGDVEI